jgi:hypothetical protein
MSRSVFVLGNVAEQGEYSTKVAAHCTTACGTLTTLYSPVTASYLNLAAGDAGS